MIVNPFASDARPDVAVSRSVREYQVKKGDVFLAVYRKLSGLPSAETGSRPVLFLVHGSSNSALSSFDLTVPGAGDRAITPLHRP